jgi:two-component system cell cycle response regulator
VDANPDRAAGLVDRLSRRGYSSVISRSAHDAVPLAISGGTDIVLVGPDGADEASAMTNALRQRRGALPVVLLDAARTGVVTDAAGNDELFGWLRSLVRLTTMQDELVRRTRTAERFGIHLQELPRLPDEILDAQVLLVGGERSEQEAITAAMQGVASVVPMTNAYVAMQKLNAGGFDVVVVALNEVLAVEFCRDVRHNSRLYNLPLVVVASNVTPEIFASGVTEVLRRPWQEREFSERVVALIRQQRYREALHRLYKQTRGAAAVDSITGLYNYSFLLDHLSNQISWASRDSRPLSVACVDIYGMKGINRTYGYAAGDRLLRQVGNLLALLLRSEDLVARHSGATFCLAMPDTTIEEANMALRRIVGVITRTAFTLDDMNEPISVFLRVGIIGAEADESAEALIERALAALA